jgi:DNA (cytosine-5)-methyltransferase 1
MGYARAGFEVVGVDCKEQKNYPFEFIQHDALTLDFYDFDAIHASPPCQDHMRVQSAGKHGTGWLLDATRRMLISTGLPYVIENVPGAPMRADFRLCGCQFGLKLRRERWFETSWEGFQMQSPCQHEENGPVVSVVGEGTPTPIAERWRAAFGRLPHKADYNEAMGINWMTRKELSQAIPPAYTEYIGLQLMAYLENGKTAENMQGREL